MIRYAYKHKGSIKIGVLNSNDENELKESVPKGSAYWNLNKIPIDKINNNNYTGIGTSYLHLKVENDKENS